MSFSLKVLKKLIFSRSVSPVLWALVFCPACVFAAESDELPDSIVTYGIPSGLPSDVANVLLQTRDGYLWIGTEAGLVRYDGFRFKTFRVADTQGLAGNSIHALCEDDRGVLWVGTSGGLSRYESGHFERMTQIKAPVTDITETTTGKVWLSTHGEGLWELRGDDLVSHVDDWLIPPVRITRRIFADSAGRMWLGFPFSGIAYIEEGEFNLHPAAGMDFPEVESFFEGSDGSIWVGTAGGVFRFEGEKVSRVHFGDSIDEKTVRSIFRDGAQHTWIVADSPYRSTSPDSRDFQKIALDGIETCTSIIQDSEGSFWIGTVGGGVARLRRSPIERLSGSGGLSLENVRTVAIEPSGTVWAGTESSGLASLESPKNAAWKTLDSVDAREIWSVCVASNGDIWVGTEGDLLRIRESAIKRYPKLKNVRSIHEDFEGNLWFGPDQGGVYVLRGENLISVAGIVGGPTSSASAFENGPNESLYIGFRTGEGVIRLRKGKVTEVIPDTATSPDVIGAIHADKDGIIWVGTKHRGLVVFRDGAWLNPETLSERFTESISVITEDHVGNLWIGTPRGIVWGNKQKILEVALGGVPNGAGPLRAIRPGDGIPGAEMVWGNQPAVAKGHDGRLFFATKSGIVAVRPDQIEPNRVAPLVQIERIVADGKELPLSGDIRIPAGTQNLEIAYTGIGFVRSDRMSFRYRLSGFSPEWTEANGRRVAYFTNLPPGRFRFQVIAGNDDGAWNTSGASINLEQVPRFQQTGWFYALMVGIVAVMTIVVIRTRTEALRREKRALEEHVDARTLELRTAQQELEDAIRIKSNFLDNMSHELRTPLNGVLGMCNLLLDTDLDKDQKEMGRTIMNSGNALLGIVSDILEYSQNETEKPRLSVTPFDPGSMAEDVVESLASDAHAKGLDLYFDDEDTIPPVVNGDPRRIRQVLTNLVGNAVKFTRQGEVVVKLGFQTGENGPSFLRFEVRDTGIGMDDEGKRRIFQSFSQVDGSTKRSYGGTGMGLAISRQLVEMMGGRVGVESLPERGSMFWFSVCVTAESSEVSALTQKKFMTGARTLVACRADTLAAILGRSLRRWGASVERASGNDRVVARFSGESLLERVPDCVVLDSKPEGYEAAAQIRALPLGSNVTIVVIGNERPAENRKLIDQYRLMVLEKPLRMAVFREVLESSDRLRETTKLKTSDVFLPG